MSRLSMDINIAHRRRWPDRPVSLASCLWLLLVSPSLRFLLIHRIAQWLSSRRKDNGVRKLIWGVTLIPIGLLRFAAKTDTKMYISNDSDIEGGVNFSDQGHIIFGPKKIGSGGVIGMRVTVGMNHTDNECPEIGRNVWIGSNCVIYGAITVGDGATLLPDTILTKSIPSCVVMQGNPARLVLRNFDNSELRKRQDIDAVSYVNTQRGELNV
jgi:serine acetyltransferase